MLASTGFAALKGLKVGLVTNHTGLAADGQSTIDLMWKAGSGANATFTLAALFSPEHGIRGILDANVPAERDTATGLTIHSLYGDTQRPTAAMLNGLDAIVVDLQDIGARYYTYMTTMAYVLEEAAPRKLKVFVLDRPNPIGGVAIDGPGLDAKATSFVGYFAGMLYNPNNVSPEAAPVTVKWELEVGNDILRMMGYQPAPGEGEAVAKQNDVHPPINCSTCHR